MSSKVRKQGERVRQVILESADAHPSDLVGHVVGKLKISRQAVSKHLLKLKEQGAIVNEGSSRVPLYRLAALPSEERYYPIRPGLAEDIVWTLHIKPTLAYLPANVLLLWNHGFTEMFNNAIDHSAGTQINISIRKTAVTTEIMVSDDGVGIFRKIQQEFDLLDERHALFELSKGKLTTDPRNHSGEGIFFTSRMFDKFSILAGGLFFSHQREGRAHQDRLLEHEKMRPGTTVFMELKNHTARTTKKVFDEFSSGDDYGFTKTVVPVSLAKYSMDELVSRSQAKRLFARVQLFETVVFDFKDVDAIGQSFADQIFRVFAGEHPNIQLLPINMQKSVAEMVRRALSRD